MHFYADNGAQIDASTPPASALYGNPVELAKYDLALFECVGTPVAKNAFEQQHVIDYANAGGRVFATHYSYVWLTNSDGTAGSNTGPKPFSQTATWLAGQAIADTAVATVDQTAQSDPDTQARRIAFASWLQLVGASTTPGQISVAACDTTSTRPRDRRYRIGRARAALARDWRDPLHYTFDTPVAYPPSAKPTKQCGRVVQRFHVSTRPRPARRSPRNARTAR